MFLLTLYQFSLRIQQLWTRLLLFLLLIWTRGAEFALISKNFPQRRFFSPSHFPKTSLEIKKFPQLRWRRRVYSAPLIWTLILILM